MRSIQIPFIFFIIIIFINTTLLAQAPDTLWTKNFGGINDDLGMCAQQTKNDGYIVCGFTHSFGAGDSDVWLIKTDESGDTLWTKTYGGIKQDRGYYVQETKDNGYIICGFTHSFGAGDSDVWLIKTDESGDTLWTKTFGGIDYDGANSVQQTKDGGYIICGRTYSFGAGDSDVWLIKTDESGDSLWTKTFGNINYDEGYSLVQSDDGGYVITGESNFDIYIIKTDSLGDKLWTKKYGGKEEDVGNSIQQTYDGGYIITGVQNGRAHHREAMLIKTTSFGDTIWSKTNGRGYKDIGYCVQQTIDKGYIVTGLSLSDTHGDSADVFLFKTDSSGNCIWMEFIGGKYHDTGSFVEQTSDGGFLITGNTGQTYTGGDLDVLLIKTAKEITNINFDIKYTPINYRLLQNYPNPFNPSTTIDFDLPKAEFTTLKIYNILGKEISTLVSKKLIQGNHTYTFDGKNLACGIYYYQLVAGDYREVKKMVLLN